MTKLIKPEAIHTLLNRGKGITKDPIRNVEQFYKLNGDFLFEYDPTTEEWYGLSNLINWLKGIE